MSGATGMRGYLLQALVCLVDNLGSEHRWDTVTVEPDSTSEKVDILWQVGSRRRAVQVKSSQNQISLSQVKQWATELCGSQIADEYELVLLGPCSQSVASIQVFEAVIIPPPRLVDPRALIEQAAHRLDHFLESISAHGASATMREVIVRAMVTELEVLSTSGTPLTRSDLVNLLRKWTLVALRAFETGAHANESRQVAWRIRQSLSLHAEAFTSPTDPAGKSEHGLALHRRRVGVFWSNIVTFEESVDDVQFESNLLAKTTRRGSAEIQELELFHVGDDAYLVYDDRYVAGEWEEAWFHGAPSTHLRLPPLPGVWRSPRRDWKREAQPKDTPLTQVQVQELFPQLAKKAGLRSVRTIHFDRVSHAIEINSKDGKR